MAQNLAYLIIRSSKFKLINQRHKEFNLKKEYWKIQQIRRTNPIGRVLWQKYLKYTGLQPIETKLYILRATIIVNATASVTNSRECKLWVQKSVGDFSLCALRKSGQRRWQLSLSHLCVLCVQVWNK